MTPESYIFPDQPIVLNPGYSLKSPRKLSLKINRMQALSPRGSDPVVLGQGLGNSSPDDSVVQPRLRTTIRLGSECPLLTTHTQTHTDAAGQMSEAQAEQLEARPDAGILGWGSAGDSPGRCG